MRYEMRLLCGRISVAWLFYGGCVDTTPCSVWLVRNMCQVECKTFNTTGRSPKTDFSTEDIVFCLRWLSSHASKSQTKQMIFAVYLHSFGTILHRFISCARNKFIKTNAFQYETVGPMFVVLRR